MVFHADFACKCCKNPWSRPAESFAPACEACFADDGGVAGLDPANMDLSVSPGQNFFRHSNGAWMKNNPIPGEYPSWNTFTALHDTNLCASLACNALRSDIREIHSGYRTLGPPATH